MDQAVENGQVRCCPQCGSQCPVDALQCGKGRKYFCLTDKGRDCGRNGERDDLAGKFERCGRLFSQCLGKRRGQGKILRTLCRRGEMPQKELQELLGIQPGSVSEITAKLEGKGLIVRVRSKEDRRKVSLAITEQGRAWVALHDEDSIRRNRAELFSALTPEEQGTLEELLDRLSGDWTRRLACCGSAGERGAT